MPGMTAYVNVIVARHQNVLLVPNSALRFRPSGGAPGASRQRLGTPEKGRGVSGTVYVLDQGRPTRSTWTSGPPTDASPRSSVLS